MAQSREVKKIYHHVNDRVGDKLLQLAKYYNKLSTYVDKVVDKIKRR